MSPKYGLVLGLFALLYAVAHFPGLEHTTDYAGFTYKILHPESFPEDPYYTVEPPAFLAHLPGPLKRLVAPFFSGNPVFLSLCTIFVKIAGDLWLDDRFNFAVYVVLTIFSIWGVERITRLFGLNRPERLTVVAILLLEHSFKDHVAHLVFARNYSPTTFGYPLAIWLGYLILRGGAPIATLTLSMLCVLTSLKTTWFPGLVAVLLTLRESGRLSWGAIAGGVVLALAALFGGYALWHGANAQHAALYDFLDAQMENSGSNPFLEAGPGNALYVLLLVATMGVGAATRELSRRVRAIGLLSLGVFVGAGLYHTFTPDVLKIPLLLALGVNRSTWWPSLIMWVVLSVSAIRRLHVSSAASRFVGWAILALLFGAPWFREKTLQLNPVFLKKLVLLLVSLGALGLLWLLWRRRAVLPSRWTAHVLSPQGVLLASFIVASVAGMGKIMWTRRHALEFLARHGVVGDSPCAKWIGVNEYFRNETPPSASVLPLVMRDYPWRPEGLRPDGSFKTRTGRTIPIGCGLSFYFNHEKLLWDVAQAQRVQEVVVAWEQHDALAVSRSLLALGSPDYIVVPVAQADWLTGQPAFMYHTVKTIGEFAILQKGSSAMAAGHEAASGAGGEPTQEQESRL